MTDRRLVIGGCLLLALAVPALAAPWIGLRDPAAQPDGLVLRDLSPLARVDTIRLATGGVVYADEIRAGPDGALEYRRGDRWKTLAAAALAGPTRGDWHEHSWFLLGTDGFGRDMLSRLLHGARVSLLVGVIAAAMALGIGTLIGSCSGLAGGWADAAMMRFTDVVLAVPRVYWIVTPVSP